MATEQTKLSKNLMHILWFGCAVMRIAAQLFFCYFSSKKRKSVILWVEKTRKSVILQHQNIGKSVILQVKKQEKV